MADLYSYSPQDVTVLVAGFIQIKGFIDGSFVTVSKDVQPFKIQRTSDGQIARLYDNDSTYTVNITLHQASDSNDVMNKLWQLDAITQRGKFPITIKDELGTSFFFASSCWIETLPALEYSTEITSRTWVIRCSQGIINVGGNAESSIIEDLVNIATAALPSIEGLF